MLVAAFIFSILLVLASIWRFGKVFNPFTMEAYFTITFIIMPQLFIVHNMPDAGDYYFYSDLVIIVYLLSIFVGTLINVNSFKVKPIENVRVINALNLLLYASLIAPLIPFLLSQGLSAKGFRQFYETVVFSKFAAFYELSKLVLYFTIFFKLLREERFTIGFFLLFPLIFVYGSRFVILDSIIYLCVFLEQFRNLSVRKIALVCLVGAAAIGAYSFLQFSSVDMSEVLISYFDIYRNQTLVINKLIHGEMDYFYGQINLSSYLKFIPRFLWEDKPKAFGFAILNYAIFPDKAEVGYMPSFGLGTTFADFGFFSIIFSGMVSGFLRNFFYRIFIKSKNNVSFFLCVFPFAIITNLFLLIYLVLDFLITKWYRKGETSELESSKT